MEKLIRSTPLSDKFYHDLQNGVQCMCGNHGPLNIQQNIPNLTILKDGAFILASSHKRVSAPRAKYVACFDVDVLTVPELEAGIIVNAREIDAPLATQLYLCCTPEKINAPNATITVLDKPEASEFALQFP